MDSKHHAPPSDRADRLWQDAAALVVTELHDDAVAEAYEVYRAELARSRLTDRVGQATVTLTGGVSLMGRLCTDAPIADCLVLGPVESCTWVIPLASVLVVRGGTPRLRPEQEGTPRRLTARLRQEEGRSVTVLLRDGTRWPALLVAVGADHVVLEREHGAERLSVPLSAVEAWGLR